ncbi:LysR family transcriptional regulator [Duganella sp. FT80W]|uniref:LysR family transcriptional regulator n=1 Tax=Duganella guangzhouensis TaxID=2666084 RepID=A0A6I2L9Q5_9BURK|nr:LysR family transcriptional regulator [Duganella guangzhouensis]MRW93917.1 LysR family transcriptional regulator [Duganella guangzhouensis]
MRLDRLDLNLLFSLGALLEEKNVTRAASRLNINRATMAGVLDRLRTYFDDRLLVPAGRRMELTELGSKLVVPVQQLLCAIDTTLDTRAPFLPLSEQRTIRIMCSGYALDVLLGPVLRRLRHELPEVTIELMPMSDHPIDAISQGKCDFVLLPKPFVAPDLPMAELFEDVFCAVVWSGNLTAPAVFDLASYRASRHIVTLMGNLRLHTSPHNVIDAFDIGDKVAIRATDFPSAARFVVGTELVATMHRRLAQEYSQHLPLRLLELPVPLPVMQICLQWPRFREHDPCHAWIRRVMGEVASAMPLQAS